MVEDELATFSDRAITNLHAQMHLLDTGINLGLAVLGFPAAPIGGQHDGKNPTIRAIERLRKGPSASRLLIPPVTSVLPFA